MPQIRRKHDLGQPQHDASSDGDSVAGGTLSAALLNVDQAVGDAVLGPGAICTVSNTSPL
jgi:hypothetical protein